MKPLALSVCNFSSANMHFENSLERVTAKLDTLGENRELIAIKFQN